MLVPSKVVSCIINPNYQRNSFWNMDDATDSTPIDTVPTWDSDAPPELIQLYQVCDTNTWWIHNESIMNPSWIPGQCLSLHFFDVGLWEARLNCDVMLMRRLRSTEETDSLATTFEHRRLDEAETGGWVEWTEPNWTDEWIDGLMDWCWHWWMFFFFTSKSFTKKNTSILTSLKRWHRRNAGS